MTWMARVFVAMIVGMLVGCAIGQPGGYVDASAWSANYTEDYIHDFELQLPSGKQLLLGGTQVSEFSKGGKGGGYVLHPDTRRGPNDQGGVARRRTSRRQVSVEDL